MAHWDPGHPYRWRTWIRSKLPWFLIDLGVDPKARDCARVGGEHWLYNRDDATSGCYHCDIVRPGQLWKTSDGDGGA